MMDALFGESALWFTAPALLATGFLLLQLIMGEIGSDLDVDLDSAADARGITLQTIAGFLVGFGWLGLAAYRFLDVGFGGAAIIGTLAGFAVAFFVIRVTRSLLKLQSDANVSLSETVGLEASVTVTIPPAGAGSGRVSVVINEAQHELPATQNTDNPINTHARVRITQADDATGAVTVETV